MNILRHCQAQLKSCWHIFIEVLSEIFDESAYARFLIRSQMTPSRCAYAAFLREHETTKARRPRCC